MKEQKTSILHEGMGVAVAERTILRPRYKGTPPPKLVLNPNDPHQQKWFQVAYGSDVPVEYSETAEFMEKAPERNVDFDFETWDDVAQRVAEGNVGIIDPSDNPEIDALCESIASGTVLMSGRHMQHGDRHQSKRPMMVFTNCSTSANSFGQFMLLLNGSGVGRSYDDDLMLVDWDYAPNVQCVISEDHPDYPWGGQFLSTREARHRFNGGRKIHWYHVEDSREGWAKAVEYIEGMAYQKIYHDHLVVLDFSDVRPNGAPIKGMQGRPSSGPIPLMSAIHKMLTLKGAGMERWKQAMFVDHYLAECVLVGGARRAARMSTKFWKDKDILQFIEIKRPIEYKGLKVEEVLEYRQTRSEQGLFPLQAFLWSSNNSVMVDQEFWDLVNLKRGEEGYATDLARHARKVFETVVNCSYGDGTGEPGFINHHHLKTDETGIEETYNTPEPYMGYEHFQVHEDTEMYLRALSKRMRSKKYKFLVNPCAEIVLLTLGGFCVIGDLAPVMAKDYEELEKHARAMTRSLIRTNQMKSIYQKEVNRTNRIGVSLTGVHEWAWKWFGVTFYDLLDEYGKGAEFWGTVAQLSNAVMDEATIYSKMLGIEVPHTSLTIKPSGTTSKWLGLSEGWHLPSMKQYLRWVSFRSDSEQVTEYESRGYPIKKLRTYEGQTIVGFPTEPKLAEMMPEELIVTAGEATPEEQYEWILLGEKYWLKGGGEGDMDNQISYTLKYDPKVVSLSEFSDTLKTYQSKVKCCSVMPQDDMASYEYQPEEPINRAQFEELMRKIEKTQYEDISKEHIDCSSGACPVDFNEEKL